MTVHVGANLGAGGATTFIFDRGEVFGWRMTIQGSPERLLDSVLPHEVTHMIFASHFRQPLPRWADEGGATSVEHASELARHRKMLIQFLKTNRGIPFNRMFAMTEYPRDVMPLYAQGYSTAEYLIQQGGRRKYVDFLADGLESGRWADAVRTHYGAANAGVLQNSWLAWVQQGSPPLNRQPEATPEVVAVAATQRLPRPEPNLIYRQGDNDAAVDRGEMVPVQVQGERTGRQPREQWPPASTVAATTTAPGETLPASGWHAAGERPSAPASRPVMTSPAEPVRTQSAHPQPVEKAQQIILEWGDR
jgi:hypothetical protein